MQVLRTPDDRFDDLPDWPFAPHWVDVPTGDGGGTLRVHHVDEGPRDAAPVLLLHGEPTWGYLYRHVVPPLVDAGHRVVVPDLVGFGRSDKPAAQDDHTYARHVAWMRAALFEALDLHDVTLFAQDWGGLVGLRLVADAPERFARVVVGNTGLPTGDQEMPEAFRAWQSFAASTPSFDVGMIVRGGCRRGLDDAVVAAYDAPFPDDAHKAGPRVMPSLVPTTPDDPAAEDNRRAWRALAGFERPFVCAFSDGDPITGGGDRVFHKVVPGTRGMPHTTVTDAGHFLQEDAPDQVAAAILAAIDA